MLYHKREEKKSPRLTEIQFQALLYFCCMMYSFVGLTRCCCQSTKKQAAFTPSKPWRKETLWRGMKWKGITAWSKAYTAWVHWLFIIIVSTLSPHPSLCLQSHVWKEDLWDCQQLAPPLPGQPVCMLPDTRTCVFCHGVHGGGRPHDAHTRRCLLWDSCRVSSLFCQWYKSTLEDCYIWVTMSNSQVLLSLCSAGTAVPSWP